MFVHILISSTSPYTCKYIRFIDKHFDPDQHIFVFNGPDTDRSPFLKVSMKEYDYDEIRHRIMFIDKKSKIPQIIGLFNKADRIILHGKLYLFPDFPASTLLLWGFYKKYLSKATWVIWGVDLYNFLDRPKDIKKRLYSYFRSKIICKVSCIASLLKEDYYIAQREYGTKAKFKYVFYPNPLQMDYLDGFKDKKGHPSERTILLGNSADTTNNHKEALMILSKLKGLNSRILCPLSYGGPKEYVDSVIRLGKRLFGKKFVPMLEFMPPKEYSRLLNTVDVAIMNHRIQEGFGNILALLYLGKKLYIRKETSSFKYFNRIGIKVFDMEQITDNTTESLFKMEEATGKRNREILRDELTEEHCVQLWKRIFTKDGKL